MNSIENKEIERKFLIDLSLVNLKELPFVTIKQGYLCYEEEREVRLREIDGKYLITYKKGVGNIRDEIEFEIRKEIFNKLWEQTEERRLEKKRYYLNYNNYLIEIDIYSGNLEGLTVAEVEFQSLKECKDFIIPDFLIKDISSISVYRNRNLIFNGIPKELKYDRGL